MFKGWVPDFISIIAVAGTIVFDLMGGFFSLMFWVFNITWRIFLARTILFDPEAASLMRVALNGTMVFLVLLMLVILIDAKKINRVILVFELMMAICFGLTLLGVYSLNTNYWFLGTAVPVVNMIIGIVYGVLVVSESDGEM